MQQRLELCQQKALFFLVVFFNESHRIILGGGGWWGQCSIIFIVMWCNLGNLHMFTATCDPL